MALWTYRCYVTGKGANLWHDWYYSGSKRFKAAHDTAFEWLEPRLQWTKPFCKQWSGKAKLLEVRFDAENLQWRVFGFHQPGRVFVVVGVGNHKNQVYDPKKLPVTSISRMKEVIANPEKAASCERPSQAQAS